MATARLFQSGRSLAVRLPKEYRFEGTEAVVKHFASVEGRSWRSAGGGQAESVPPLKIQPVSALIVDVVMR